MGSRKTDHEQKVEHGRRNALEVELDLNSDKYTIEEPEIVDLCNSTSDSEQEQVEVCDPRLVQRLARAVGN